MQPVFWLIIFAVMIVIEILTLGLTTIWFAAGAAVAFFIALAGAGQFTQFAIFIVISFVMLILARPVLIKYTWKSTRTKTNVNALIGAQAKVTERVDNSMNTGVAIVDGKEWTARAIRDDLVIDAGTNAIIRDIRGVKLILSNFEEEEL